MGFEVFVIQHSHIDIGYTERQEKIADYHAQFISQAVKFANSEKQSGRGADHLFKFNCEGFWAVEQYLKKYGDKGKQSFIAAVQKGYIELSPFYFHFAELLDVGHIRESLQRAASFALQNDLPLHAAMGSDINGFSWGMAEALADLGIKYLMMNINSHHGGAPFGKPLVPFYWESPSGKKILVWSGLAYHKANLLGLIPGFNPVDDPGIPGMVVLEKDGVVDIKDINVAEKKVFQMVDALRSWGYSHNFLPVMGSGLYTDNSPVTEGYCDLVEQWNKKHGEKIHIQTSTLQQFFQHVENYGGEIPSFRGDWNDWWTDGTISTPLEVKLFRNAQRNKRLIEMLDPGSQVVSKIRLGEITEKLMLFSEHTWGHSSSYTDPWKFLVQQLQVRKSKYAIEADELASIALDDVQKSLGEGEFTNRRPFEYKIINPTTRLKRYVALLPVDFWEVDAFKRGFKVTDDEGNLYKCQHTNTLRGWSVAVEVELQPKEERLLTLSPDEDIVTDVEKTQAIGNFENEWYIVSWSDGGIESIRNKKTGSELLDCRETRLGMPVYQIFPGGDRRDSAGFGYSARKKPENEITHGKVNYVGIVEQGTVFTALKVEYEVPGASCYRAYFIFYSGLEQIALNVEMTKDIVTDPEGMYTAFPFDVAEGKWYLDKPGALILPGRDQLPGTCCDYYAVDGGAILAGEGEGVCITMLDSPLVTIGRIKLWDFTTTICPTGTLYSWLCNNKWETNFKADCGGFYEFRYLIAFSAEFHDPYNALERIKQNNFDAVVVRK